MTKAAKTRKCPECGAEFELTASRGKKRVFCSDQHKQDHANRRTVRGKQLVALAQGWRKTRGSGDWGKFLFGEVTSMLDTWNAEDLKAGRMDPAEYAKLVCDFQPVNPDYFGGQTFHASRHFDRKGR